MSQQEKQAAELCAPSAQLAHDTRPHEVATVALSVPDCQVMITEGAIRALYNSVNDKSGQAVCNTVVFNPVVQVIDVKKIQGGSGATVAEHYMWVKFAFPAACPRCC
jgi:hypothetical protein